MKKAFGYEGYFWTIMNALCDLVEISVLFLLFSIPLVSIGASVCASYYVVCKKAENSEKSIFKMFFHSWKQNLKDGFFLELICGLMISGSLLGMHFAFISDMPTVIRYPLLSLSLLATLVSCMVALFSFMLLARYNDTLIHIIRNSLIAGFRQLPGTILALIIHIGSIAVCIWCIIRLNYTFFFLILVLFPVDCLADVMIFKELLHITVKEDRINKDELR